MSTILISGGSGLVGRALTKHLVQLGHEVRWLSRKEGNENGIKKFRWDLAANFIDPNAFESVTHLVHLAGAGIADKRWTDSYKKELWDSRIKTSELLYESVRQCNIQLDALVGASAVGYYGDEGGQKHFSEEDPPGNDFLARLCVDWEKSYQRFNLSGTRTALVRTSVVLSKQGGALKKMLPVFKLGLGSPIGKGSQSFPWIHLKDLVAVYTKLLFDDKCKGPYNAAADEDVTNREFSKKLAQTLGKPCFLPAVPEFILRIAMGEAATVITRGQKVNNQKLRATGLRLEFPSLNEALKEELKVGS